MYDFTNMKAGDKFEMLRSRDGARQGDIVEFERYDCDDDPVFRLVSNRAISFWISDTSVSSWIKPAVTELDGKWIVWNVIGSDMATSEADAKAKAEELVVRHGYPVYIAQAQNRVARNQVAWLK